MILPHQRLVALARQYSLDWPHIGPASVDLRIGPAIIAWEHGQPFSFEIDCLDGAIMYPGTFYLASSIEEIYCPPDLAAFIQMRSSFARRGLGHKMAGFVDPGFRGQITFELETAVPLRVKAGERIAQAVYVRLEATTLRPYEGKYMYQQGPTPAYSVTEYKNAN